MRSIIFEEEERSTVAFNNVQVLIHVIEQEVNLDPQSSDNIAQPFIQNEIIVHEDQT